MYAKTKTGKASRGTVGYEAVNGRLRLTIPSSISPDSKQKRPTLGLSDTPANRAKADAIAMQANLDLANNEFDVSLGKYLGKAKPHLSVLSNSNKLLQLEPTINEIWIHYLDWIRPKSKPRTMHHYETDYFRLLEPYLNKQLNQDTAIQIRNDLVKHGTHAAKRVLAALENAVEIAVQHGKSHIVKNPFFKMSEDIKVKKRVNKLTGVKNDYRSFTESERNLIINKCCEHSRWFGNFIYAKFHTGARPGELQALVWNDISPDFSKIYITKTYEGKTKQVVLMPKNGEERTFNCPKYFVNWLRSLKPENAKNSDLVFTDARGNRVHESTVQNLWAGRGQKTKYYYPGIVETLARNGLIAEYLPCYNTRHTYINLALESGYTPSMVTRQCGNSEDVINEYYRSKDRNPNWDLLK
jgi:integrase